MNWTHNKIVTAMTCLFELLYFFRSEYVYLVFSDIKNEGT